MERRKGIITWQEIYVPKDLKIREQIIWNNHDDILAGHPGQAKTYELITQDFWWPKLRADITKYISGCETCQRTKTYRT